MVASWKSWITPFINYWTELIHRLVECFTRFELPHIRYRLRTNYNIPFNLQSNWNVKSGPIKANCGYYRWLRSVSVKWKCGKLGTCNEKNLFPVMRQIEANRLHFAPCERSESSAQSCRSKLCAAVEKINSVNRCCRTATCTALYTKQWNIYKCFKADALNFSRSQLSFAMIVFTRAGFVCVLSIPGNVKRHTKNPTGMKFCEIGKNIYLFADF